MSRWQAGAAVGLLGGLLFLVGPANAGDKTPAERGREALLGRSFTPPVASRKGFDDLWKVWGLKEKPADYDAAVRARYGLHPAPYENNGLPMGLREAKTLLGGKGLTIDCMLCHGGSVAGHSYVGLGNSAIDLHGLFQDLAVVEGGTDATPYRFSNVNGTIEATAATVYFIAMRDTDLKVIAPQDFGPLPDQVCEDTPAWWHLKRKKTLYANGGVDARAVRSLMAFMLTPFNSGEYIKKQEPVFADIKEYLRTLEAPKYPYPIDEPLAARGKEVFAETCARCHGSYGKDGKYPSKVIPLEMIGTDPALAQAFAGSKAGEHYANSWFGQEKGPNGESYMIEQPVGYQAPPLDGVWASAPYFHNGAAPTVYHVLNSKARPKVFTRSYSTGEEDYDKEKLGWKVTVLDRGPDPSAPPREQRKVYDTTQPGRGNGGHTFGDKLSDDERRAVIEYLKTL